MVKGLIDKLTPGRWPPKQAELPASPQPHLLVGYPIRLNTYCFLSGARISIEEGGHITVDEKALLVGCAITIPKWPYEDYITVEGDGVFVNNWIDARED